ncbi:PHD finger protein 20-like protein 1 isoform X2 [Sphaerodactylus townsendi]|uniref:PHD finger protein 20-like protein 1 isoform X2 n=1 Tax=Sphaerodactylus townsendi TaxID=933632 RepID=UPI002027265F|nr:PHD finger protein 20-like protein 1 isoform X2 [Sphaerodactylus townsendi]
MSRKPPNRPGITFEIGARLEALDYLQKWYPSRIEKIDYEEGKMLVHFERWSHRYDEWIYWDSNRLRPLERPSLRKEAIKDEDEFVDFKPGEEVLARWTDCRYYPAKIEAINKEGTFTVQFYDGVIRCLKRMHVKSMPEDAKGQAREWEQIEPELRLVTDNERHEVSFERCEGEGGLLACRRQSRGETVEIPSGSGTSEEDWIALVKAAAVAAAKNKAGAKPRTSANSNKDKEERKWFKVHSKKEESSSTSTIVQEVQKKEEQPTSRFPLVDVPKIAFVQAENALAHKRKNNLGNSFQAKRARLNKITGLLASKAVGADGAEKKEGSKEAAPVLEQEISPKPQSQKKNEAGISSSANIQKPALLPSTWSTGKARSKKCKQESGDSAGCIKPPKSPISPDLIHVEDFTLASQLPPSVINKTIASVANVSLEKRGLCLPLDLSRNLDVPILVAAESAFCNEHPSKEKEDNQMVLCHPSRAGTDGRIAPVASGKKKEKEKERKEKKEKDHKLKQKKKKKKKKKSKLLDYSDFEDSSLEYLDRCSSPLTRSSGSSLTLRSTAMEKNTSYQYPRAILSVDLSGENLSDMEFLDDSSTESLLLSGDEYNQDFDSTNFEESQDEEDTLNEIVRCVCEMDEENGFMIQCEECLCWQHSVCMGLLEDSIPEQYVCYVCRDPPGQRWSAKYFYDKDWLNNGHLCGLSFLKENYSHLNAKKIVSTHHLLADVYGVTEILRGLQLKIGILTNKHHPDLHLWACTGVRKEQDQKTVGTERRVSAVPDTLPERTGRGQNHKEPPSLPPRMEETYITSEHSYQKPQSFVQDCKLMNNPISSDDDDTSSFEDDQELLLEDRNCLQYASKEDGFSHQRHMAEGNTVFIFNEKRGAEEHVDARLQWQLNLLTHIENVQNEVTNRMDLIEKEVDVLESWLDFTGELEPPDPLARLPQLKRRIKQLISDMGKVQQIATLCSV